MLIIRRSELHYTASGIITPIGDRLVHRLREDWSSLNLCTRRPPIGVMIPEGVCILCFKLVNPLNAELNPICHLLALLGAHHILHVSRIRVNY